jgi:RNA polymerase sigma-70 factor (ECF subfamily)
VRDLYGWGTVAVARPAVDVLRSARLQREAYIGPWLPERFVEPSAQQPTRPTGSPSTSESGASSPTVEVLAIIIPTVITVWTAVLSAMILRDSRPSLAAPDRE